MTKSTHSTGTSNCVDVTVNADGNVEVRDTKLGADSPVLVYTPSEWGAFILGSDGGEFDYETLLAQRTSEVVQ